MFLIHKLFKPGSDKSVKTTRTIIGADVEIVAGRSHFLLIYDKVSGLRPNNHIHRHSPLVQPLCLRIDRSRAHPTGDEDIFLLSQIIQGHFREVRRDSERSDDIGKGIPHSHFAHLHGGGPDCLNDNCHSAGIGVIVTDCKRDALPFLVRSDNQKLPRKSGRRDPRSSNFHPTYRRSQKIFLYYLIHKTSLLHLGSVAEFIDGRGKLFDGSL